MAKLKKLQRVKKIFQKQQKNLYNKISFLVVVDKLPSYLEVEARTADGVIMYIPHRGYSIYTVQFHPEAVLTEYGHDIIKNFIKLSKVVVKKCIKFQTQISILIFFDFFDKLENKTEAALLDSSLEGDKGKFSILGLFPYLELKEDDNNFYINGELSSDNLENYLASYLKENKIENTTELPLLSGAIAYFSYDYGRKFEKISSGHDKDIKIPEAIVSFYDIFDTRHKKESLSDLQR